MKIYYLIYLLFLIVSCQNKPLMVDTAEEQCDCTNLPKIEGASTGYQFYTSDSASFTRPFPNPNNANEFLFVHRAKNQLDMLYSYNLQTNQKHLLLADQILFVPKWGLSNWILINRGDKQIWKLKSNGDSLQQVSFQAPNYVPEWDYEGKKILFYKETNNPYSYIMNSNGLLLDSLRLNASAGGDWNHPQGFFIRQGLVANGNVYIADASNQKPLEEIKVDDGDPLGVTWVGTDHIFASTLKGLYWVDVPQKTSKKLKCACATNYYLFPRYWKQQHKIIAQRVKLTKLEGFDVKVEKHIVQMDIDGTHEEIIPIPL